MLGIEIKERRTPCRLVVFDKDGTIVDFAATWLPIIRKRAALVSKELGGDRKLETSLLRSWGIDPESGKIDPRGPGPVSPRAEEIVIGTVMLYQRGIPWDEAKRVVARAFDEADAITDRIAISKAVDGIHSFLTRLKREGFFLALATNDERRDTEAVLASLNLANLFDAIICAGEIHPPKPHPEIVFAICRQLSIPPGETVFVGDTVGDMMAGKEAGVALTIGVLEGGITPREELEKVADAVVDSIRDIIAFKGQSETVLLHPDIAF